jgi:hypothetical protein
MPLFGINKMDLALTIYPNNNPVYLHTNSIIYVAITKQYTIIICGLNKADGSLATNVHESSSSQDWRECESIREINDKLYFILNFVNTAQFLYIYDIATDTFIQTIYISSSITSIKGVNLIDSNFTFYGINN